MFRFIIKVILLASIIRLGYKHRYKLMNTVLQIPLLRSAVVNKTRNFQNTPIGLITRVYL